MQIIVESVIKEMIKRGMVGNGREWYGKVTTVQLQNRQ